MTALRIPEVDRAALVNVGPACARCAACGSANAPDVVECRNCGEVALVDASVDFDQACRNWARHEQRRDLVAGDMGLYAGLWGGRR